MKRTWDSQLWGKWRAFGSSVGGPHEPKKQPWVNRAPRVVHTQLKDRPSIHHGSRGLQDHSRLGIFCMCVSMKQRGSDKKSTRSFLKRIQRLFLSNDFPEQLRDNIILGQGQRLCFSPLTAEAKFNEEK